MSERPLAILLAQEVIARVDLRWLAPLARDYLEALGTEDFVLGRPDNAKLASELRAARVQGHGTA